MKLCRKHHQLQHSTTDTINQEKKVQIDPTAQSLKRNWLEKKTVEDRNT